MACDMLFEEDLIDGLIKASNIGFLFHHEELLVHVSQVLDRGTLRLQRTSR